MADLIVPPIRNLIVLITNQCNLACPYCFESRDPKKMNLDIAKDVLAFLHGNSDHAGFTFFGGEPCLEWDKLIFPLIEHARGLENKTTRFAMTTNGTLLDKERIDYLIDNDVHFMLSMDGRKCTQDVNRPAKNGTSSFDKLESILPYLLERRPFQQVRGTITGPTIGNLYNDILWFEQFGVKDLAFLPNLFETWSDAQKVIFTEQIRKYEEYIIESFRKGVTPIIFREYGKSFWRIIATLKTKERRVINNCPAERQCGFGVRGSGSCDVFGNIYGCHHVDLTPDSIWCIGNIYDGVDEDKVRNLVSMYDSQKVGNEQCYSCPIDYICNGGCTPNNWQINGDMHKVPELFCFWTRTITDSAYRVCQILGSENNELFAKTFSMYRRG